jgi:crotonobetainyl-CoA:carnitine CoA-transferase CaiB-like acyl-CoA transferase
VTALDGVKVLCVGQFYFAPYCTMLMARLGADVIKVEGPEGDPYRRLATANDDGTSIQFQFMNSGKRTIRLNLKTPGGRSVLRRLAVQADVLVQNLSPGAMERFGLGYEELSLENPRLIMASGTGFGSFGPYAGEPAMDLTIQARSAVMSTTGFADGAPVRTGPSVVDFMAGTHLLAGVLAALYQRASTGMGQHVEVALQDAIIPSLTSNIAGYLSSGGAIPERTGNRHGGLAVTPYNAYEAADGWITVLCPTDSHWDRLCTLMKDPATDDERFRDMKSRSSNGDAVDAIVGRWVKSKSKEYVAKECKAANIPCAPVVTLPELIEDTHVRERGMLRAVNDDLGTYTALGSPLLLSDSPEPPPSRAGGLGEHTDQVLREELGMAQAEIDELRASGAL